MLCATPAPIQPANAVRVAAVQNRMVAGGRERKRGRQEEGEERESEWANVSRRKDLSLSKGRRRGSDGVDV